MTNQMTRERLERFRKAQAQLDRLARVARRKVADKVKGSLDTFPYIEVDIAIIGLDEKLVRYYRQKKRRVEAEKKAVITFVDSLGDLYMAELIRERYLERKSWVDIWAAHSCAGTVESYRMAVSRYLDK